jgi:uncharacterized protein with PIN domain
MGIAFFRFYEELNDFLPSGEKKVTFEYPFSRNQSVKDAIEALGVPHVEIDMILVNGNPVDFTYKLKNEDRISVYPVFETLDISKVSPLRKKPLRDPKFILDVHLGRLAKYMRLFGLDTLYSKHLADPEIIKISLLEHRIIITRDRNLLKNKVVTRGYWIRSPKPEVQLREVLKRFSLKDNLHPFTRCLECNNILSEIPKEKIVDRLLPGTKKDFNKFRICTSCDRIYWEGSHFQSMKDLVEKILISE